MEQIEGIVSRVFFFNPENHYAVIKIELVRRLQSVTAVGILPGITPNQRLCLTGQWITHPRYGRQFRIERYEQSLPTTVRGIREYLASGQIEGVGLINAARIVNRFGDDTVRVLDEEPKRLREVPGLGQGRADAIAESWKKHHRARRTMIWLQGHGISAGLAAKIHEVYDCETIRIVRENPYRLITDIRGVGFKRADLIAREIGIARDAPSRVQAGVIHTLKEQAKDGNVFTPLNTLVSKASRLLAVPPDLVREAVESLQAQSNVHCDDGSAVYLVLYYAA
ncbi:MAG: hypothetical protein GY832_05205 [Chloroflexi bacterium]|nr:hypothetical protein [Chloroflexota bacterium]